MAPELEIMEFSFQYPAQSTWALEGISLTIPSGSCCALLGPTGAGKSTFLSAISGIRGKHYKEGNASGAIRIGEETYRPFPHAPQFPVVLMALQDTHAHISGLYETVEEEIGFTLLNLGRSKEEVVNRVQSILEELGILHLRNRSVTQLSEGELHRVALATILVAQPSVLLLDEPLNALDQASRQRIKHILSALKVRTTVLFTDYDIDLALALADNILLFDQGRTLFFGERTQFLRNLHHFSHVLDVHEWNSILKTIRTHRTSSPRIARVAKYLNLA